MYAKKKDSNSNRLAAMLRSAVALNRVGAIGDRKMRLFESLCVKNVQGLAKDEIKISR